jgi:hypothetical protein
MADAGNAQANGTDPHVVGAFDLKIEIEEKINA